MMWARSDKKQRCDDVDSVASGCDYVSNEVNLRPIPTSRAHGRTAVRTDVHTASAYRTLQKCARFLSSVFHVGLWSNVNHVIISNNGEKIQLWFPRNVWFCIVMNSVAEYSALFVEMLSWRFCCDFSAEIILLYSLQIITDITNKHYCGHICYLMDLLGTGDCLLYSLL